MILLLNYAIKLLLLSHFSAVSCSLANMNIYYAETGEALEASQLMRSVIYLTVCM